MGMGRAILVILAVAGLALASLNVVEIAKDGPVAQARFSQIESR